MRKQRTKQAFGGPEPLKKLGQNFLVQEEIAAVEVEEARVEGKTVLEIGPGLGALTKLLAEKAKKVIAVEKDGRLIPELERVLSGADNVEIINADFLEYEPPPVEVVVSNVPYSISAPLLLKLGRMKFERALLCLQKEFAEKMVAKPGERKRSRLSVVSQLLFDVKLSWKVPRTAFRPQPKVDSRIVLLEKKQGVFLAPEVEKTLAMLFSHKKKRLRNALADSASLLGISKETARGLAGKLSEKRVFQLTEEEVMQVARDMGKLIK